MLSPIDMVFYSPVAALVLLLVIVVIIAGAISFLRMKATPQKQEVFGSALNEDLENKVEEEEKEPNKTGGYLYVLGIIISVILIIVLININQRSTESLLCFIPLIQICFSLITRLKNKEISNILCIVAIIFVILIACMSLLIK